MKKEKADIKKKKKEEKRLRKEELKTLKKEDYAEFENFTQDWIPFEKTIGGLYKTKDGRYVKVVEIEPITFLLRSLEERASIIGSFYSWLKIAPVHLQFQMTTTHVDASRLIQRIEKICANEKDPHVIRRKNDLIKHVRNMSSKDALSKRFFIIYQYEGSGVDGSYSDNELEIWREMEATKNIITSYFGRMENIVTDHENEIVFAGDLLYKSLNPRSSRTETFEDRVQRVIGDSVLAKLDEDDVKIEDVPETYYVAPRGCDFTHSAYNIIDGMYVSYLYIKRNGYKNWVTSGWFESLTNFGEGVTINMYCTKKPRYSTIEKVGRAMRIKISESRDKYRNDEDSEGLLGGAQNAKFIKDRMTDNNEDLYDVFTMITIQADKLSELKKREANIKTLLTSKDIMVSDCSVHGEEAARMNLPLLCYEPRLVNKGKRNFLTSSLASTYMYTAYEVFDEDGIVLGLNGGNASLVAPNPFNTAKYPNANMIILGTSGMGKTFLLMTLAYSIRLTGKQVFVILPEKGHEWKKMVQNIGGEFIELAPGSTDCINIMAIRPQQKIDADLVEDFEEDEAPLLSKKIHQIITFLQLNMTKDNMSDEEEASISTILTSLYMRFGITSDNDSIWEDEEKKVLKPMPIIEDFYEDAKVDPILSKRISTIIATFVTGDGRNMNAQTNVNLQNKFVVISVSKAEKRMIAPFAFLAIDCSYDAIKADRTENCALIMDEVWKLMINQYASEYVMEIYKIIRGYGGSAISATQELDDLNKSVNGAGIINNAKIKFILGMEKKQAKALDTIIDFDEDEIRTVARQERGQALFISNGDKIPILIKAPNEWMEFFTTDAKKLKQIRNKKAMEKKRNEYQQEADLIEEEWIEE